MNVPAWAQKRADRLAAGRHDRTVLVAYPQSRGVFAVPIIACIIAAVTNIGVLLVLLIAARGSGVAGTRTTVLLITGIVVVTALFAAVAYLVIASFRTSVLATPRGVEIRQLGICLSPLTAISLRAIAEKRSALRRPAAVVQSMSEPLTKVRSIS